MCVCVCFVCVCVCVCVWQHLFIQIRLGKSNGILVIWNF